MTEPKWVAADNEAAKAMNEAHPHAGHGCPQDPEVIAGRASLRLGPSEEAPQLPPGFQAVTPEGLKALLEKQAVAQAEEDRRQRKLYVYKLAANIVMNLAIQSAAVAMGLSVWSHWLR